MADSFNNMPARGRFAAAGAGFVVQNRFAATDNKGKVSSVLFMSLMLLALTISMVAIVAILAWAFVEGRTRLDLDLIFNGPSTVNRATAGFSVAIQGTLQIIGGVIAIIIPLGVGAALYLEQFADKTKWWNRLIELNIQNLAGVPSIVFGILGLAFFVRGPFSLGFVVAAGSATIALAVSAGGDVSGEVRLQANLTCSLIPLGVQGHVLGDRLILDLRGAGLRIQGTLTRRAG